MHYRILGKTGLKVSRLSIGTGTNGWAGSSEQTRLGLEGLADLLRVMWSNGVPQNQFRPAADQTILEPQVLKGSCPYLYCWDGEKFVLLY